MLYKDLKALFELSLDTHIRLLKLDWTKHSATKEAYEFAFDLAHDIWEKMECVDRPINDNDQPHEMIEELYDKFEDIKEKLKKEIDKETDLWVQNLLLSKLDQLQLICAKLESLMDKEYMLKKALEM